MRVLSSSSSNLALLCNTLRYRLFVVSQIVRNFLKTEWHLDFMIHTLFRCTNGSGIWGKCVFICTAINSVLCTDCRTSKLKFIAQVFPQIFFQKRQISSGWWPAWYGYTVIPRFTVLLGGKQKCTVNRRRIDTVLIVNPHIWGTLSCKIYRGTQW